MNPRYAQSDFMAIWVPRNAASTCRLNFKSNRFSVDGERANQNVVRRRRRAAEQHRLRRVVRRRHRRRLVRLRHGHHIRRKISTPARSETVLRASRIGRHDAPDRRLGRVHIWR